MDVKIKWLRDISYDVLSFDLFNGLQSETHVQYVNGSILITINQSDNLNLELLYQI